jgi:Uma2 family endonuclease
MITQTQTKQATIEDLYHIEGKAEIVNGEVVFMPPTGDLPGRASGSVYISLRQHEKATGLGRAVPDNVGFVVNLPNRKSFNPDAAFHFRPPSGMKFINGAPAFAIEVRSEDDYGKVAELRLAQKRADYFAAGTLIVWDVDLLSEEVIKSYHATAPDHPVIFRRGEIAHAEPVLPAWQIPVDDLFS